MLVVNGMPVGPADLLDHPAVQAAAAAFVAQGRSCSGCTTLPGPALAKPIYACQGEQATVDAAEEAWLCTSDATTCVALVAVATEDDASAPGSRLARVVHHDESTALGGTLAGLGPRVRLWLAGGYSDARGVGARVAARLLGFLAANSARCDVQLACLGRLNTTPGGAPACTALALDLRSLTARPAEPQPPSARGPMLPARLAQWAFGLSGCSSDAGTSSDSDEDGGGGSRALRGVYDAAGRCLRLRLWHGQTRAYLLHHVAELAALPDAQLLQNYSTSPEHEPPHFVGDARAAFAWLLQQAGPVRQVTHCFEWSPGGGWQPAAARGSGGDGAEPAPAAAPVVAAACIEELARCGQWWQAARKGLQ